MDSDEKRREGSTRSPTAANADGRRSQTDDTRTPPRAPASHSGDYASPVDHPAGLRPVRKRCEEWYDNAPVGCLMLDRGGIICDLNRTAATLLGNTQATLLNSALAAWLAPANNATLADHLSRAFATGEPTADDFKVEGGAAEPLRQLRLDSRVWSDPAGGRVCLATLTDVTEHRRTEAALRESEERFRVLVEAASQAVWETNAEGVVVEDSPTWRAYTGQALEEWLGHGWIEAIHPSDRDYALRVWHEAVAAGTNLDAELRLRIPDEGWRWTNVRAAPIRDREGKILKWVGMNLDVTEHKRTTQALQAREQQQAAVAELGQRALTSGDFQELLDAVTAVVADILGVEYAKVLELLPESGDLLLRAGSGWHPGLVGHAVVGGESRSQAGYTLATSGPVIVHDLRRETRFRGPALLVDHAVVSGVSCVIAGPKGRPWGVLGAHTRQPRRFTRDDVNFLAAIANVLTAVIERQHFLTALHEREADLNRAQAVGGIGSWRLDVRRNRLTWSAQNHRIFGIPEGAELTYESFLAVVHPDDREYVDRMWQAGLRGKPYDIEHRVIVDGRVKWVRERAELEFDQDGAPRSAFGTTHDITERKRAEGALREDDRRKNEFLAMLAHELRNPLAPIRNAVEILQLHGPRDPTSEEALSMIERQLRHMVHLIDDLLDISRVTRGKLHLRRERIALTEIIDHAVEASRPEIERAGHRLTVSLPSQHVYLDADPVRLTQVFLNLLNNACRYMQPQGSIEVRAERREGEAVVRVKDTGKGIPPQQLPQLFEMFSQTGSAMDTSQSGLGIGLPLSRRLVEMHGGSIEARSEGLGHGSEFVVRLPAAAGADMPRPLEPKKQEGVEVGRARRILVVDDNVDIAQSLAMVLQLAGNEVQTAYDGLEATEAVERCRPDVVLLDIGMPRLDGYAACRRIRRQPGGEDILIIALTGWGQDDDREKARDAGFDAHLVKPVEPSVLMQLLAD